MKYTYAIILSFLLFAMTACQPEDNIYPLEQSAFNGRYSPQMPILQIRHDQQEEGAEAHSDPISFTDHWTWSTEGSLSRVEFDIPAGEYTNYNNSHDDYFYNSNDRLDSVRHTIYNSDSIIQYTYHFSYSNGQINRISFLFGQESLIHTVDFLYHNGKQHPYAIVFTRPLPEWLWGLYHTDTLVQQWTLVWSGGNLMRATADSMAAYCTGISYIEYLYDNHPNPCQGYFSSKVILNNGFIDNPSCLCRNNLVRRIIHHCTTPDNSTSTSETNWTYRYLANGYPGSVTVTTPTLYWTEITTKSTFTYDTSWRRE